MDSPTEPPRKDFALIHLLPNVLTIGSICAGLTAIRSGTLGDFHTAVLLIFAASILDGLDGRLARALKVDSKMGAELDSLADFLNFGVAPALLLYFWALEDTRSAGWLCVLIYTVCCVVRLARFNVSAKSDEPTIGKAYFVGVPSPAGAMLVMLPMYVSFAFTDRALVPDLVICVYMVATGLMMISRIPTWSFKATRVSRENVKYFLVAVAFVGAAVLTYAWVALIVLCVGYIATVVWALLVHRRKRIRKG
jgi:CDP-diacylglycerol--serine O-phosphatidyltransferase